VPRITLGRAETNAINPALSKALHASATHLHMDTDLRVGIIAAKGDR